MTNLAFVYSPDASDDVPFNLNDRATILGPLTDLFLTHPGPSRMEAQQFADLACRLLPMTRADIRLRVAQRLAGHPFTPSSIVDTFLLLDGPECVPLLERSTCFNRTSLLKHARHCDLEAACVIAGRMDLDQALVQALLSRNDLEIMRKLARNLLAPLARATFGVLVDHARHDATLAKALCARARDPLSIAPLFMQASPHQRALILRAAWESETLSTQHCPPSEQDLSLLRHLERAADEGAGDEVAWVLSRLLSCEPIHAKEMLQDTDGEVLSLLLSALYAPQRSMQHILHAQGISAPRTK